MANGKSSSGGGISWTVLFAGVAVLMSLSSGLLSVFNPKSDLADVKKEISDFKWQVSEVYVRKDLASKELEHLNSALKELSEHKVNADVYEQKIADIQNRQSIQRTRIEKLDTSVNLTYSAKDALKQMQDQISDLQRALRGLTAK